MMIDRRGLVFFVSTALATTCDAFSLGVTTKQAASSTTTTRSPVQRQQIEPLRAFASDKGETRSQYEHFSISTDGAAPGTFSQETTIAPPPMARPATNNKLAKVEQNANNIEARAAPPPAEEEVAPPVDPVLSVWERNKAADVQGGSLRTWSFADQHRIDMIQVHMKTDGRPMNANGKKSSCFKSSLVCNQCMHAAFLDGGIS